MAFEQLGRYQIKAELGRGGMATVYHAVDPSFGRDVAIKVLPREYLHDRVFRARFEREARTIATLDHPAIVPVFDVGEEDGLPFLVMRYMKGGSLADRIDEGPLPVEEAGQIMRRITDALSWAHKKNIIHRDIKPDNIMFDEYGYAYLSDFGIVKLEQESANLTGTGMVVGTPAYIAPELAESGEVTPSIDIYALGVTLFEMLTGERPYDAATPHGILMQHITKPIPVLRSMAPDLHPDLQIVLNRAMAKNPADRYDSPTELSGDLQKVIDGQELDAIQPTMVMKEQQAVPSPQITGKARRSGIPAWVWLGGGGVLLAGFCIILAMGALFLWSGNDLAEMIPFLASPTPTLTPTPTATPTPEATPTPVPFLIYRPVEYESDGQVFISWAPDSEQLAVSEGSSVKVWDVEKGQVIRTLTDHQDTIETVAWSPDGTYIAASGGDGDLAVQVWDASTGDLVYELDDHTDRVKQLDWSSDGKYLASAAWDWSIIIWDIETGRAYQSATIDFTSLNAVDFSPDDRYLAVGSLRGEVFIWDIARQEFTVDMIEHQNGVNALAWSPDGEVLVSASSDSTFIWWDPGTGQMIRQVDDHGKSVVSVNWSPDGRILATGSWDEMVMLWATDGSFLESYESPNGIYSVAFSPDGRRFATGIWSGWVWWEIYR